MTKIPHATNIYAHIAEKYHLVFIVLFGSHVRGDVGPMSDRVF